MAVGERLDYAIRTREDIARLRNVAEQQYALLILEGLPNSKDLELYYESVLFEHLNDDGKKRGTRPDFLIRNTETKKEVYVEITVASFDPLGEIEDPKLKQKSVMESVAPKMPYVVLYKQQLRRLQGSHRGYDFFGGKKVIIWG